ALDVRIEAPDEVLRRDRPRALDGREQIEGLIEVSEAATEDELVDRVADDEDVDERFAARQMCDDARGELQRGFEALRIVDVRVEDDADAREVLLDVLAHHRIPRARPDPRAEIAD